MVLQSDDDWQRQVIERAKELDHLHRRRARPASESSLARVLSLRLLARGRAPVVCAAIRALRARWRIRRLATSP
jgi:hypothetical protein